MNQDDRIRIFTWHIHGSYLFYLAQCDVYIYLPVADHRREGCIGWGRTFRFGCHVIEVCASSVRGLAIDCSLYQSPDNYLVDQCDVLSESQRQLPRLYLEHSPPCEHSVGERHVVNDPGVTIVHVTLFNNPMWDNHGIKTVVIDHGISALASAYTGRLERGIMVINQLAQRGRRLELDTFEYVRDRLLLDLIGTWSEAIGGLGEVQHPQLPGFLKQYRFFFNPIQYISLGRAVREAMIVGLPVVGFGTTEMPTVFKNGVPGWIHTDVDCLVEKMKMLLQHRLSAMEMGANGCAQAMKRLYVVEKTALGKGMICITPTGKCERRRRSMRMSICRCPLRKPSVSRSFARMCYTPYAAIETTPLLQR